jgi:hypothetical protein
MSTPLSNDGVVKILGVEYLDNIFSESAKVWE